MTINQEVVVNDDGVHRLGVIVGFECDEWVWVRLTGQARRRRFWIEQVKAVGGATC